MKRRGKGVWAVPIVKETNESNHSYKLEMHSHTLVVIEAIIIIIKNKWNQRRREKKWVKCCCSINRLL